MTRIFHPTVPGLHEAIMALCEAITAETHAYRAVPCVDEVAEAAGDRANRATSALYAFDKSAIFADMAKTGDMAFTQAMALSHQRWLISGASYQHQQVQDECLLVDFVLASAGKPFCDVQMLWHIDGENRTSRPSDAELQKGWEK